MFFLFYSLDVNYLYRLVYCLLTLTLFVCCVIGLLFISLLYNIGLLFMCLDNHVQDLYVYYQCNL